MDVRINNFVEEFEKRKKVEERLKYNTIEKKKKKINEKISKIIYV